MIATRLSLRRLRQDTRGATLVEFAFVAPILCFLLVGAFDVGHTLYVKACLQGALQKAARDAGLESGMAAATQALIDQRVKDQLRDLGILNSQIDVKRRFYRSLSQASAHQPETFTDTNSNGRCDGEPYEDANNNNVWDQDGGDEGQGGARDSVVFTVKAEYPRMFPLNGFLGIPATTTVTAVTVMNNQPFGEQGSYGTMTVRTCAA